MTQGLALHRDTPLATVRSIADLRAQVALWRRAGESIGFVPTMGGLHAGHLALARQAQTACDRVVVSIFVNPMQFDRKDDLVTYPRDEAGDAAKLTDLGIDLLYMPTVAEMYPDGFTTTVSMSDLTGCLCGAHRPGHFPGVCTVVTKLFDQVAPDVAYFGEKDFQQYLVIKRLVRDLDLPIEIRGVATVREIDGLALASRNQYLNAGNRGPAAVLYRILESIAAQAAQGDPVTPLLDWGREELAKVGFYKIDYLEMRSADSLELLELANRPARVFAAAWLGGVRLIDNVPVG